MYTSKGTGGARLNKILSNHELISQLHYISVVLSMSKSLYITLVKMLAFFLVLVDHNILLPDSNLISWDQTPAMFTQTRKVIAQ